MTCREYLGRHQGHYCKNMAEAGSSWCLEHIAVRQSWEMRMERRGKPSA